MIILDYDRLWFLLACSDTCCKMYLQQTCCGAVLTLANSIFEFGHTSVKERQQRFLAWNALTDAFHTFWPRPRHSSKPHNALSFFQRCSNSRKDDQTDQTTCSGSKKVAARGCHHFQMCSIDFLAIVSPNRHKRMTCKNSDGSRRSAD